MNAAWAFILRYKWWILAVIATIIIIWAIIAYTKKDVVQIDDKQKIYRKGDSWYAEVDGTKIEIDEATYNSMKAISLDPNNCVNPNVRDEGTVYNLYGYKAYQNACGGLTWIRPLEKF